MERRRLSGCMCRCKSRKNEFSPRALDGSKCVWVGAATTMTRVGLELAEDRAQGAGGRAVGPGRRTGRYRHDFNKMGECRLGGHRCAVGGRCGHDTGWARQGAAGTHGSSGVLTRGPGPALRGCCRGRAGSAWQRRGAAHGRSAPAAAQTAGRRWRRGWRPEDKGRACVQPGEQPGEHAAAML